MTGKWELGLWESCMGSTPELGECGPSGGSQLVVGRAVDDPGESQMILKGSLILASICRTTSVSCSAFPSVQRQCHLFNIATTLRNSFFASDQTSPWKQKTFLIFQMHQRTAEVHIFRTACFFLLNHHLATFSKPPDSWIPKIEEHNSHIMFTTQQSKNKWEILSGSSQNTQDFSFTSLLFARLSLVRSLLLLNSHKKTWTLEGMHNSQIAGGVSA